MICIAIISQKIPILHITKKTLTRFFAKKLASFRNIPYICTVIAYYYGTGCRIKSGTDGFSSFAVSLQNRRTGEVVERSCLPVLRPQGR